MKVDCESEIDLTKSVIGWKMKVDLKSESGSYFDIFPTLTLAAPHSDPAVADLKG